MKTSPYRSYLLPFALLLLASCTTLGVPTPQTFNEKVAVAVSTVRGVISTSKGLLAADKLTPDDVDNIIKQTDAFMEGIAVAETLHTANAADGENKLATVVIGLNALNNYILARK